MAPRRPPADLEEVSRPLRRFDQHSADRRLQHAEGHGVRRRGKAHRGLCRERPFLRQGRLREGVRGEHPDTGRTPLHVRDVGRRQNPREGEAVRRQAASGVPKPDRAALLLREPQDGSHQGEGRVRGRGGILSPRVWDTQLLHGQPRLLPDREEGRPEAPLDAVTDRPARTRRRRGDRAVDRDAERCRRICGLVLRIPLQIVAAFQGSGDQADLGLLDRGDPEVHRRAARKAVVVRGRRHEHREEGEFRGDPLGRLLPGAARPLGRPLGGREGATRPGTGSGAGSALSPWFTTMARTRS